MRRTHVHRKPTLNASTSTKHLWTELSRVAPASSLNLVRTAGEMADKSGLKAYVVGGLVRDLFLDAGDFDLDLVVEGDGLRFARQLGKVLGGKCRTHERFQTATLELTDGQRMDVATARTETYAHPAALPEVKPADIHRDLFRRDFTINAMAIQINGRTRGRLLDYFGGLRDVRARKIRALHSLSFKDDPTRIFRAVRFEQRYQFSIERNTARWMRAALKAGWVERLSRYRITNEVKKILAEEHSPRCFRRLEQMGFEADPRYATMLRSLAVDQ